MLKTTLIAATTIDGFIAQVADQVSTAWTSRADKLFFSAESKRIGALIMGRPTYATMLHPLVARLNIVLTSQPALLAQNNLSSLPPRPTAQPITDFIAAHHLDAQPFYSDLPPADLLAFLTDHGLDAVAICGGARVYNSFLSQDLVDELALTVEGTFFTDGIKLISSQSQKVPNLGLLVPKGPKFGITSPEKSQKWTISSVEKIGATTLAVKWLKAH